MEMFFLQEHRNSQSATRATKSVWKAQDITNADMTTANLHADMTTATSHADVTTAKPKMLT